MVRFGQIVLGPAGSGKSTYCTEIFRACQEANRVVHCVNLDPAAEHFNYPVSIDIRDLISLDDVLEESDLGPNGALVFCLEYFLDNIDWIEDKLIEEYGDDDYFLFDLPGQIELYTHFDLVRRVIQYLSRTTDLRICAIYMIDATFMSDVGKFLAGTMTALSAMVQLEVPHINVMSKMDLVKSMNKQKISEFLIADTQYLLAEMPKTFNNKFAHLNRTIATLLEDFNMVNFIPLDISDDESARDLLLQADFTLQYHEELDPKYVSDDDADEING